MDSERSMRTVETYVQVMNGVMHRLVDGSVRWGDHTVILDCGVSG